ncbi:MAG TPA: hypothetical protein VMV49_08025, partial [Candidatus Deferrimicrobium sp.]|nr:hypothetical protein [Candidatus Deferrimicrobium sp.]
VYIEANQTGTITNYPMTLLSGSLQDGIWNYTFTNYPLNTLIFYRIFTIDIFGNINTSNQFNFGVFDTIDPTIVNVVQNPVNVTILEPVEVTGIIIENFAINSVEIESNHTGIWMNYSMDLLSGTLQNGIWNYTFINWQVNNSIWYRIFATDVVGRTAVTDYTNFGIFPIIKWNIPLDIQVKIGEGRNKKATLSFEFQNTGTATLLDLDFTIIYLPANWTANIYSLEFTQLGPGENLTVEFRITANIIPEDFIDAILINFDATILETGEEVGKIITVVVAGFKEKNLTLWIIIIVGSAAAAASSSYIVIRKRHIISAEPKYKTRSKTLASLKTLISTDFTGTYSVLSFELMERINNLKGLTLDERELLIQDISQLDDDDEAKQWIDDFERSSAD